MTKRTTITFRVKEYANGKPWIVIEPYKGDDLAVFNKLIGFDLPEGTTFEAAEKVCEFLRENIEQITES